MSGGGRARRCQIAQSSTAARCTGRAASSLFAECALAREARSRSTDAEHLPALIPALGCIAGALTVRLGLLVWSAGLSRSMRGGRQALVLQDRRLGDAPQLVECPIGRASAFESDLQSLSAVGGVKDKARGDVRAGEHRHVARGDLGHLCQHPARHDPLQRRRDGVVLGGE